MTGEPCPLITDVCLAVAMPPAVCRSVAAPPSTPASAPYSSRFSNEGTPRPQPFVTHRRHKVSGARQYRNAIDAVTMSASLKSP
jgi:hypothetical protein